MSEERALTWSKKWHIVESDQTERRYAVARCGAHVYRNDDPQYPPHLKEIRDGKRKDAGLCELCARSAKVTSVTVELPEATTVVPAPSEDENGYREWEYPHGSIHVFDDGTAVWGQWHGVSPEKLKLAAAALLAAAKAAS